MNNHTTTSEFETKLKKIKTSNDIIRDNTWTPSINDLDSTVIKLSSLRKKANHSSKYRCNTLICILENPKTIENVCSIIRTINTLGVAKLYVIDNKNIIKENEWEKMRTNRHMNAISVSAIKWTYLKKFSSTLECIQHLNDNNYVSIVTSPHIKGKTNVVLEEGNYTQKKLAVWFGNETHGISDEAIKYCHSCVQIKMFGIIESINLSVSAGIVLYEITKQRRKFIENKSQTKK
jgi:tRNA (guanosine-2'-O-)-methyltransferase